MVASFRRKQPPSDDTAKRPSCQARQSFTLFSSLSRLSSSSMVEAWPPDLQNYKVAAAGSRRRRSGSCSRLVYTVNSLS